MEGSRALEAAVEAAHRAGDLLLGYFGSLDPSEVEEKGRNDVVSRADRESEALVKEILLGAFPGDLFIGEEGGAAGSDADAPAWIVDPLDGTANFVRGFPHWAVSIGRTAGGRGGELVLGVVWDPSRRTSSSRRREPAHSGTGIASGFRAGRASPGPRSRRASRSGSRRGSTRICGSSRRSSSRCSRSVAPGARPSTSPTCRPASSTASSSWGSLRGTRPRARSSSPKRAGVVTDFDGGGAWRERGNLLAAGPGVHAALAALVADLGVRDEEL